MAEYIDLDTPLEAYRLRGNQRDPISTTLRELLDFNKIPYVAADVAPVRHGRWERKEDPYGFFDTIPVCSVCDCTTKWREEYLYCPNCGAKMDKEVGE